jgi:hypothetical protein
MDQTAPTKLTPIEELVQSHPDGTVSARPALATERELRAYIDRMDNRMGPSRDKDREAMNESLRIGRTRRLD